MASYEEIPRQRSRTPIMLAILGCCSITSGCAGGHTSAGMYSLMPYVGLKQTARKSQKFSPRVASYGEPIRKGGGRYKLGSPYSIKGVRYVPRHEPNYDRVGIASWYGDMFHGRLTANGEVYDMERLTAAHPTLPLPSLVKVTNKINGRQLIVRVNDRGPYAHNRIIDLSRRSAELLGMKRAGTVHVRVKYLGPAPISGDDRIEQRFARSGETRSPSLFAQYTFW